VRTAQTIPGGEHAGPLSRRLVCAVTPLEEPPRRRRWVSRAVVCLVVLVILASCAWLGRQMLLSGLGSLLVSEDPPQPVAVLAVSNAVASGDAMEAARLYREHISTHIVLFDEVREPVDEEVRRLGVPLLGTTDLARTILERAGVPTADIAVLSHPTDGTGTEIAVLAEYVRQQRPPSLMYITARSHTRRARWLLRRAVSQDVQLLVRAARTDTFTATAWWQSRKQSREAFEEGVRWINSALLGDAWG